MSIAMPASNTLSLPGKAPQARAECDIAQMASGNSQPSMSSHDILRGQKAVEISHNGSTYRLQATRLGKLILTK